VIHDDAPHPRRHHRRQNPDRAQPHHQLRQPGMPPSSQARSGGHRRSVRRRVACGGPGRARGLRGVRGTMASVIDLGVGRQCAARGVGQADGMTWPDSCRIGGLPAAPAPAPGARGDETEPVAMTARRRPADLRAIDDFLVIGRGIEGSLGTNSPAGSSGCTSIQQELDNEQGTRQGRGRSRKRRGEGGCRQGDRQRASPRGRSARQGEGRSTQDRRRR